MKIRIGIGMQEQIKNLRMGKQKTKMEKQSGKKQKQFKEKYRE